MDAQLRLRMLIHRMSPVGIPLASANSRNMVFI